MSNEVKAYDTGYRQAMKDIQARDGGWGLAEVFTALIKDQQQIGAERERERILDLLTNAPHYAPMRGDGTPESVTFNVDVFALIKGEQK